MRTSCSTVDHAPTSSAPGFLCVSSTFAWHLGLTDGATEHTKGRYAFVYGDFRRLHRMGLIACHYRAAEWGHKDIELAAHNLLQYLDGSRS